LQLRYDAQGQLTDTYDHYGARTTIQYDVRGRKLSISDPNTGLWQNEYNAFGELIRTIDPKGTQMTMTYDNLGRLSQRSIPSSAQAARSSISPRPTTIGGELPRRNFLQQVLAAGA
jgi:YD repeat-containing protein